jgi:putative NADH-flavin reductase
MNIAIFGAGGRAGRQAVAEAHRRDPAGHRDLADARVVAGDVTDAVDIEHAAAGFDAAISAAVDLSVPPYDFFTASSRALTTGLAKAGVRRLVVVGLASIMPP